MPDQEARDWYQYYFHTERGHRGLEERRREISRLLWETWSPSWSFDEDIYEQTAASFYNPDFVDVVIHSYSHWYGVVGGDPAYAEVEARLARQPDITIPSIVVLGADDGVDPPQQKDEDGRKFIGFYNRRVLPGVGHNVPQEAPTSFADAIRDARAGLSSGLRCDCQTNHGWKTPCLQYLRFRCTHSARTAVGMPWQHHTSETPYRQTARVCSERADAVHVENGVPFPGGDDGVGEYLCRSS